MTLGGEAKRSYQREYMRRRRFPLCRAIRGEQVKALSEWSEASLVVPSGHPRSGEPLVLPGFAQAFLEDALSSRWSLMCCARKMLNRQSARFWR